VRGRGRQDEIHCARAALDGVRPREARTDGLLRGLGPVRRPACGSGREHPQRLALLRMTGNLKADDYNHCEGKYEKRESERRETSILAARRMIFGEMMSIEKSFLRVDVAMRTSEWL